LRIYNDFHLRMNGPVGETTERKKENSKMAKTMVQRTLKNEGEPGKECINKKRGRMGEDFSGGGFWKGKRSQNRLTALESRKRPENQATRRVS